MLKKIAVDQAVTGMFVHQFCGSWMDHPFWSSQLFIADAGVLRKIRESDVREIIIDTDRGLDILRVDSPSPVTTTQVVDPHRFQSAVPAEITATAAEVEFSARLPASAADDSPCSITEEIERAQRLIARGKRDVIRMFEDVRLGRAVEGEGLQLLVSDMSESLTRNAHALLGLVRIKRRDEYTYMHSVAVAALMLALARSQGFNEQAIRIAGMAGLLHDLGKVAMPGHILNKPGKLSEAEFDVMRGHPRAGANLLKVLEGMPEGVIDACLHHHEKMDGSGYPDGLAGEQISLLARMAAICDVYDAITSNRPYHAGWDPASSLSRMASWQGHFDPRIFQLFVRTLGIYPIGSLVRLTSGRLAIVIEQNSASLLKPRLRVFYSADKREWLPLETLDLSDVGCGETITGREEPEAWGFAALDHLWTNTAH